MTEVKKINRVSAGATLVEKTLFLAALALMALYLLVAPGCTLQEAYVAADQATYDAVAPEYEGYVNLDTGLTEVQKERRRETLRSWKARLAAQEPPDTAEPPSED